jgi:hypothetical protein
MTYTTQYRFSDGVGELAAVDAIDTLNGVLFTYMENIASVPGSAIWYPLGSHVSFPVTMTPQPAGAGAGPYDRNPDALQWQALGRSPDGRRVSYFWQGLGGQMNGSQRVLAAADAGTAAILDALDVCTGLGLCTISGTVPVFKRYLNQVVNDYLTHKARRG